MSWLRGAFNEFPPAPTCFAPRIALKATIGEPTQFYLEDVLKVKTTRLTKTHEHEAILHANF
jgi:hypothetical protein